jgi:hypothetical protein
MEMRSIAARCARSPSEGTWIIGTWIGNVKDGLTTPWVRTVVILWLAQVVSEIGFGFALPFTPLYVQELGVTDIGQAGLWAGFARPHSPSRTARWHRSGALWRIGSATGS